MPNRTVQNWKLKNLLNNFKVHEPIRHNIENLKTKPSLRAKLVIFPAKTIKNRLQEQHP